MHYFLLSLLLFTGQVVYAGDNDTIVQQVTKLPDKYLSEVTHKSHRVEEQVNKRTEKALARFTKQEKKMQAKLWKVDSVAAKNIFTRSIDKLNSLKSGLKNKVLGNLPLGGNADLDTLQNSLKFLE
jgi:hypothetical protein